MKIALYIEDGLEQIVLTPESDTERDLLGKLHDSRRELSVHRGSFYACNGGWMRHGEMRGSLYGREDEDRSTILVMRPVAPIVNHAPPESDVATTYYAGDQT